MAIKGYLNEISFLELLKVIGKHDGKLGIWNFATGKQYEIFFKDEQLTYINQSGRNLHNVDEIKAFIQELLLDDKSYYKFEPEAFSFGIEESVISLAEFFSLAMNEKPAESVNNDALPNLETRFETVNKIDIELFGELSEFWSKASAMLHRGASGRELSSELNLHENETLQALYNLRVAGLIKPMRVFNTASPRLREKMMSRVQKPRHDQRVVPFDTIVQKDDLLELDVMQKERVAEVAVAEVPQIKKEEMIATAPMPEFLRELAEFSPELPSMIMSPVAPAENLSVAETVSPQETVASETFTEQPAQEPREIEIFSTDSEKTGLLKRMLNSLFRR